MSPSSAYGSLEDLQYYSGGRTRSTEYLFPTPFSKWYSSSQSESGFSGSGFYRSPRTPRSIGGSDFGDYRTPSMFGDFHSASRSSSVFGDNIELSLPTRYERYDADFNLIHSPRAGSEVEEHGRHSRAGSVFSGSELSYTEMGASPNILESSLKSHDWVSRTDFERHAGYGTDEETMSLGSTENDGEFVSMHDKSLDIVYEDDVDVAGEVFDSVDDDELDDAESLSSSGTNSVVCVTDVVIVSDVVAHSGEIVSEGVSVCVDGNSTEEQLTVEDRFTPVDNLKIDIQQLKSDSEMEFVETIDSNVRVKTAKMKRANVCEFLNVAVTEVCEVAARDVSGDLSEDTRTESGDVSPAVGEIERPVGDTTKTRDNQTLRNHVESITAESNTDADKNTQDIKYREAESEILSDEFTLPSVVETDISLGKTESAMKENNINNSTSLSEESVHLASADITADTDLSDSTHPKTTTDGQFQEATVHNNNTGRKLQTDTHEYSYIQDENTFDPGQSYSDEKQTNIVTRLTDANSLAGVDKKVTDIYNVDKRQTSVNATNNTFESGTHSSKEENSTTAISGLKYEFTDVLKGIGSTENVNDTKSVVSTENLAIGENMDSTESSNKTVAHSVSTHTDFSVSQPLDSSTEANVTGVHTANITNQPVALHTAGSYVISSENSSIPGIVASDVCTPSTVVNSTNTVVISTLSGTAGNYPIPSAADQHALKTDGQNPVVTYTDSCRVLNEEYVSQTGQSDPIHKLERRKQAENKLDEVVPGRLDPIKLNSSVSGEKQNEKNTCNEETENRKLQELLYKGFASGDSGNEEEDFSEHSVVTVPEKSESGIIKDIQELTGSKNRTHQVNTERKSSISERECELFEIGLASHQKESVDSVSRSVLSEKGFTVCEKGSETGAIISEVICDSAVTPKMMENTRSSFDQLTEDFESETYGSEPNSCKLTSSCESIDSGYDTLKKSWVKTRDVTSNVKKRLFTDTTEEMLSVSESDDSFIELDETGAIYDMKNKTEHLLHSVSKDQHVSCDRGEQFEKVAASKQLKVNLIKRTYKITKTNVDIITTRKRDAVVDAVKHTHLVKLEKTVVTAQGPKETPTVIIDQSNIGKETTVVDWCKGDVSSTADLQHISQVKNAVQLLEGGKLQSAILDSSESNISLKSIEQPNVLVTATLKSETQQTDTPDIVDTMDGLVCEVQTRSTVTPTIPYSSVQVAGSEPRVSESGKTSQLSQIPLTCSETDDKQVQLSDVYHETDLRGTIKYSDMLGENTDVVEHRPRHEIRHDDTHPDTPQRLGVASSVLTKTALISSQSVKNDEQTIPLSYSSNNYQTENEEISSVSEYNDRMFGEMSNQEKIEDMSYQSQSKEIHPVAEYYSKGLQEVSSQDKIQVHQKNPLLYSRDLLTGDNAVKEVTEDSRSQYNKDVDLVETSRLENTINSFQQQTAMQQVNVEFVSSTRDNENKDKSSQVVSVQHTTHFLSKDNFPESLNQDPNVCTTGNTDVQYDIGIRDNGGGVLLTPVVDEEPCSNTPHNKLGDKENKDFIIEPQTKGLKDLYNSEENCSNLDSGGIFTTTEDERSEEIQSGRSHSSELDNKAAGRSLSVYHDNNTDVNTGYVGAENNVFGNRDISQVVESRAQVDISCVNTEATSQADIATSDIYDSVDKAGVSATLHWTDPVSVTPVETSVLQNRETETGVSQPITADDTGTLIRDDTATSPLQRQSRGSDYTVLQQTDQANYGLHGEAGSKHLESQAPTELIIGPETLAPSHSGGVVYSLHARADKEIEHAEQYTTTDSQLFLITNDKRDTKLQTSCVTVKVSATVNRCKIHGVEGCPSASCVVVTDGSRQRENSSNTMNRSREVEFYDNVGFGSVLEIIEEGLELIEEDIQHINKDSNIHLGGGSYTETTKEKPVYIQDPENRLDFLREQLLFTADDEVNNIKSFQTSEGFLCAADSTEDLTIGNVCRVKVTGELSDTSLDTSFSSDHVENVSWSEDVTERLQGKPDHTHSAVWLEEHERRNPHFATIHRVDDGTFEYSTEFVAEDDNSGLITDSKCVKDDNSAWIADSKDDSKWIHDSVLNADSKDIDKSNWIGDSKENGNSELTTSSRQTVNSKWTANSTENDNANQVPDSKWTTDSKISNNSQQITDTTQNYNSEQITYTTQNYNSEQITDTTQNYNSEQITDTTQNYNSEQITDTTQNYKSEQITDSQENYSSQRITDSKQLKVCTHHGHVHSFSDEQLKRNLQSFEELLKDFDTNSEESILSNLVFTIVFLNNASGGSYTEKMKKLYHILLLEDMERLQNHLCPVIYGSLQLDSHRMQHYLLRGYSRDMATVWHTKRKRVLDSLLEQHEECLHDDGGGHLPEGHSSVLQKDRSFQSHCGAQRTADHSSEEFHRLSDHSGHYKVITGTFSRVSKLPALAGDRADNSDSLMDDSHMSSHADRGGDDSLMDDSHLSSHANRGVDDSLMDYSCVSSAADDDALLMEEFKKLELLEEDGLLLDDQLQRLRYYQSRFIKYNPYLQNNPRREPAVPFRNTSWSEEDMDVN